MRLEEELKKLQWQFEKLRSEIERPLPTFAGIHNHDTTASQNIPTGTTYTKITSFTDNSVSQNCTADVANDKITITDTGVYLILGTFEFTSNRANTTFRIAPFLGGVEQDLIHIKQLVPSTNATASTAFSGNIAVSSVPVDLDARVRHDNGLTVTMVFEYAHFTAIKIAEVA